MVKSNMLNRIIIYVSFLIIALFKFTNAYSSNICNKGFTIQDATAYDEKYEFLKFNINPIKVIYIHSFWDDLNEIQDMPSKSKIQSVARSIDEKYKNVVIDIEHWDLFDGSEINKVNEKRLIDVIEWMREVREGVNYGHYALIPVREYHRSLKANDSSEKIAWIKENDKLNNLVDSVDTIYPSLYTVRDKPELWKKMAVENLKQARRISNGKPVHAFLWPQYHEGNKEKRGQYLDKQYWRMQLETVYANADGIVIWGGWDNGPAKWDSDAGWWIATKEFLIDKNSSCPEQ